VLHKYAFSSSTQSRLMAAGLFPKPERLGPNIVAWRESELRKYDEDPATYAQRKAEETRPLPEGPVQPSSSFTAAVHWPRAAALVTKALQRVLPGRKAPKFAREASEVTELGGWVVRDTGNQVRALVDPKGRVQLIRQAS